jgi:hypothetical protein|tara:strand:+ start:2615 stop:2866 length:252 start_codon:yes stop_codon:yes gene_type:complete
MIFPKRIIGRRARADRVSVVLATPRVKQTRSLASLDVLDDGSRAPETPRTREEERDLDTAADCVIHPTLPARRHGERVDPLQV